VQHTSTSSMSSGSTTCLFYRDLGAGDSSRRSRSLQDISNGSETHRGERTYGHCLDSTAKKGRRIGEEEPRFRFVRTGKGWECSAAPRRRRRVTPYP
jgi:hypothetical protein